MNATESFRNMFKKYELSKFFSNLLAIENSKQNTRLLSVELERDWRKFVEVTFVFGGILAFLTIIFHFSHHLLKPCCF